MSFTWSHPRGLGPGSTRCGTQEGIEPVPAHVAAPRSLGRARHSRGQGEEGSHLGAERPGQLLCSAGNGRLVPPTASAGQDLAAPVPSQAGPARCRHGPVPAGARPRQPNLQPSPCPCPSAESAGSRTHPLPAPIPLLGRTLTSPRPTPPRTRRAVSSRVQPSPGPLRPPGETHVSRG